ncbi:protein of unknown function [Candidatus Nitrosocosmicus franklandus]|uniref:Uncharacterized protein n=1 Tax=Candidatus Nitrosocosmicus franklandianus TaxID=1798806 RepID=A0A484IB52_9ARCH|nr:protein of unknown function [Candidatus Nitrosocosmicus franklandus]
MNLTEIQGHGICRADIMTLELCDFVHKLVYVYHSTHIACIFPQTYQIEAHAGSIMIAFVAEK